LHEDEIIVWIQTAAFINDLTEIYKKAIVHTDLQMCQRKFRSIKYKRRQSYAKFGMFLLGHPVYRKMTDTQTRTELRSLTGTFNGQGNKT